MTSKVVPAPSPCAVVDSPGQGARGAMLRDLAGSADEGTAQGRGANDGSSQCVFRAGVLADVEPAFCACTGQRGEWTSQLGEVGAEQHFERGGGAADRQRSHRAMARCEMADPARGDTAGYARQPGSRRTATGRIDGGQRSEKVYFFSALPGRFRGKAQAGASPSAEPAIQTSAGPEPLDGPVPSERQPSVASVSGRTVLEPVSTWSSELILSLSRLACGSKEFDPPFPFPQGQAGAGMVPPTPEARCCPAKSAGQHRCCRLPPTRGLPPPCASPASAVVEQVGLSRKAELSMWLKTGTFYLALTPIISREELPLCQTAPYSPNVGAPPRFLTWGRRDRLRVSVGL